MKTLLTKPLALILFLFVLGLSPVARADTQYSYAGDDFTSWTNTACPPACHITGSLILATPLLTGLNFADVTPLSYSFTDGITTWTDVNAPGGIFEFATDPMTGAITFWVASLAKTQDPSQCDPGSADLRFLQFESTTAFALNSAIAICATDTTVSGLYDAENTSSGMWTVSTSGGTPVPEPNTLLMLALGIAGVIAWCRGRCLHVAKSSILSGARGPGTAYRLRSSILGVIGLALLSAPVRAQSTLPQLGCPVRTDTTVTSDTRNHATCNLFAALTINNGVDFLNEDSGVMLVGDEHQPPVFNGLLLNVGTIHNLGDIVVVQTTGTLINSGTLNNNLGRIFNDHTLLNNGTLNNNKGSALENRVTGTLTNLVTLNNSSQLFDNFGTINNLAGAVINNLDGGILTNIKGSVLNNFYLLSNSALGTIMNNSGATLNNELQITNFGMIDNQGGGAFNNDFVFNGVTGSTLQNDGTFTNTNTFITNGTTNNGGIFQNQSTATLQNFGIFNNSGGLGNSGAVQIASGGVLNNTGSIGNTSGGGFAVLSGGTFNNSGSFLSDYLSSFGSQSNSTILNTGDMSLGGNTVAIGGSLRNNGTITMVAGPAMGDPAIQPPAPPLLITSTGKLSGTGTVNQGLFGVGVINQGVMAPGDPLGTFTIVGNYQQTSTGTLDILLGGVGADQFGQLDITGGADLSGTLDVELFAGFDPQSGEIFEILESGGITNLDFLSMLFPTLPDGLFFKLDQEGSNLFLDVLQGEGGGGGGTNVPEPGTAALLLSALALMFVCSRCGKRASIRV